MSETKKYTCKCKNCDREFGEEEFKLTNDENKCILHCKKDDWKKDKEQFFSNVLERYIKYSNYEIVDIHFPFDRLPDYLTENKTFNFNRCHFKKGINFFNYHKKLELFFMNCFFYGDIEFYKITNIKFHFVNSCCFNQHSIIANSVIFTENIEFIGINDIKELNFNSSTFKGIVDFNNLSVSGIGDFGWITCESTFSVTDSVFQDRLIFDKASFENNIILSAKIKSKEIFDLSHTIIKNKSNFYKISINKLNRETARIIKDSFEQQNNIIEANNFYALEMKEREKELEFNKEPFEWLVFKIHSLSSNHSQDWLLSLFWIVYFTFAIVLLNYNTNINVVIPVLSGFILGIVTASHSDNMEKTTLLFLLSIFNYGLYSEITKDFCLHEFTNKLNPFSIMNGWDDLNFGNFIYKIIIAYLIYQLIISIRQNTRRK